MNRYEGQGGGGDWLLYDNTLLKRIEIFLVSVALVTLGT